MLILNSTTLPDGSPEQRQVIAEAVQRFNAGEVVQRVKPAPIERPKAIRAIREAQALTGEEIKARRLKKLASHKAWRERRKKESEQGIRPAPPKRKKKSASKATFCVPEGTWVTFTSRFGLTRTCRILAHVPAKAIPPIPEGCDLRQNSQPGPARMPRYLLAMPCADAIDRPPVLLMMARELEKGIQKVHEGRPHLPDRLATPLAVGTPVSWITQGHGKEIPREGVIVAFIPSGMAVSSICPEALADRDSTMDISIRDRYLITCERKRNDGSRAHYSLPPAYQIEREFLKQRETAA